MQPQRSPKINFREIFWVVRFSTFATISARNGHGPMSDLRPLSGEERKSSFGAVRSVDDPGCVKTCTSRECAELFSLFSSFNGDCQSGSFLNQRNRDKLSTRKFDVGVFTQPGPRADYPNAVLARY